MMGTEKKTEEMGPKKIPADPITGAQDGGFQDAQNASTWQQGNGTIPPFVARVAAQAEKNAGSDPFATFHVSKLANGITLAAGHPVALATYAKQWATSRDPGREVIYWTGSYTSEQLPDDKME